MRAATDQLLAMLEPVFPGRAFIGEATGEPEFPYVVLMPALDEDEATRLGGLPNVEQGSLTVVAVGSDANQAMWAAECVDRVFRPNGRGVTFTTGSVRVSNLRRRITDTVPDDSAHRVWRTVTRYSYSQHPVKE